MKTIADQIHAVVDNVDRLTAEIQRLRDELQSLQTKFADNVPTRAQIPPFPADPLEVVYAEGWNACCDQYFGGGFEQPAALIIEVST